ncbi:MAG: hypothetical protein WCT04_17620 [Planctomycetota bacterium]
MNNRMTWVGISLFLIFAYAVVPDARASETLKWDQVPKAVQDTVLANGGAVGQSVDKENEKIDGKVVYEAPVKGKDGKVVDLVITEDGKLRESKSDDAADADAEKADRAKRVLAGVKFSHPRDITNPYLPLASLKQDILEGTEAGKKIRVERTLMPKKRRTFTIGGEEVESLVMEDRVFLNGELEEVVLDYFAQDDNGTVYYLGEEVDEYENGKVKNHKGSWMLGKDTPIPGVIMPAHPKVGDKFKPEDVSKDIMEEDEVMSISETVTVPAGTYKDCLKIKEHLADGTTEYKYYAKGVGVVRENPPDGNELLISHNGAVGR